MRGLLDAAQSLERQLDHRDVMFRAVVFIRTDIYDHLVERTPDRGKESTITLEWDDPELFREIVLRRIHASTELTSGFADAWQRIAPPLVGIEDSFTYLLDRTLRRPRDLLMFLSDAIQVALDRGHDRIEAEDIQHAEQGYSENMLVNLLFEIEDTHPQVPEVVYGFQGAPRVLPEASVEEIIRAGAADLDGREVIELLLWYGVLGIRLNASGEEQYSYDVRYNVRRLLHQISTRKATFVVHPAFRAALGISAS